MKIGHLDLADPKDLGWRRARPGARVETEPAVYETMRSFVDAQGDADLPRMTRLEAKLREHGWELVPEYGAAVYQAAQNRTDRSEESFATLVRAMPEGSTVRAELEKHLTPPREKSESERRREHDAKVTQLLTRRAY